MRNVLVWSTAWMVAATVGLMWNQSAQAQWGTIKGQVTLTGDFTALKLLVKKDDATVKDAAGIGEIWNTAIRDTTITFNSIEKTDADISAATQSENPFFVWDDGQIMGFTTYFPFRAGIGYLHTVEHSILLHPAARGQGIGRKLLTHVCDHARAADKHSLIGVVSGENDAGLAFHQAMGFVRHGTLPQVGFKFGRWLDAVFLQKRL